MRADTMKMDEAKGENLGEKRVKGRTWGDACIKDEKKSETMKPKKEQ